MKYTLLTLFLICAGFMSRAQGPSPAQTPKWQGKFEQLGQMIPSPNEYRSGSGAPGPKYWQQRADYVINAELDDEKQKITGSETITYFNNSPDVLKYIWIQLDQNINEKDNNSAKILTSSIRDSVSARDMAITLATSVYDFDGGFKITSIKDAAGTALTTLVNQTMMRVDLPSPLAPGKNFSFSIDWWYNINDRVRGATNNDGRSGMEFFPEDKNYLYIIGQWFPRMCVYDDVIGWQNKQFLGQGEFTLLFGNYTVNLTVPSDHIVGGTGMVQNLQDVLTPAQYSRFEKAKQSYDSVVVICTQAEAIAREKTRSTTKKVWKFYAENVRDFAFATSRKFIWDAQAVKIAGKTPLAMSYYPKEGNPLWGKESTKAVKNTIVTYSKYSVDYPYPQATSVHAASLGMEYPMICFNHGRPRIAVPGKKKKTPEEIKKEKEQQDGLKWGMIGVIIHEVGHNFFPMIISNDERQWTWMDEGLNTFVQSLTQIENYKDMPVGRGSAAAIVMYMKSAKDLQRPLMINSEQVVRRNFGNEQYAKCATALTILRETVMGHELFDRSFKEYANRWAFHHPNPGDFFRTMEDVSAVDLDWFWRGWFYSTDNVSVSLDKVKWYQVRKPDNTARIVVDKDKKFENFEGGPEVLTITPTSPRMYGEFQNQIDDASVSAKLKDKNFYEVTMSNLGGLVTPVILEWTYKDGSKEIERIPVEIWRNNEWKITKVFTKDKEVASVVLDPLKETSDIDVSDNSFPRVAQVSKFDELKKKTK